MRASASRRSRPNLTFTAYRRLTRKERKKPRLEMSILFLMVLHWEAIVCPLATLLPSSCKSLLSSLETDLLNLFTSKERNLQRAEITPSFNYLHHLTLLSRVSSAISHYVKKLQRSNLPCCLLACRTKNRCVLWEVFFSLFSVSS